MTASAPALSEAELLRRLEEAEETLRAIRDGEVDALVMRRSTEDTVFSLDGQESYREFMECMDIGAAALDASGRLLYANSALCELLGRSAETLMEQGLIQSLDPASIEVVQRLIEDDSAERRTRQISVQSDTGRRHLTVTCSRLSLGFGPGLALTFTDVTERIESLAAHESERIGRAIMSASNDAVIVCNGQGIITQVNAAVRALLQGAVLGEPIEAALPIDLEISSGLLSSADLVDAALSGSAIRGVDGALRIENGKRDLLISAIPLRRADGNVGGCVVTLADVTDSRASEERQALMVKELAHRVRNTLALVMAISQRTAAGSSDLAEFRNLFGQRIEALAATHSLLAAGDWSGLTLEDLVGIELAPYVAVDGDRVRLRGLAHRITSDTAVTLGLMLHELVTNAVKYGSLSNDSGAVEISARLVDGAVLEIDWRESGGPPVKQPTRRGFGQTLISRSMPLTGGRTTKIEFAPEGFHCMFYVAASAAVQQAKAEARSG